MKKIYLVIMAAILFLIVKPSYSYAYNGYQLDGQNYGTFDYRDISQNINKNKGYMIVTLGTNENWYGKQLFVSKRYYNLNGIYKMNYDGLYTFDFYVGNNKIQSVSYYMTNPPKIIKVIGNKVIYQKIVVKL